MPNTLRILAALIAALASLQAGLAFNHAKTKSSLELAPLEVSHISDYVSRVNEIDGILEYMVWPDTRKQLIEERLGLLQAWAVAEPTVSQVWVRLLAAQHEAGAELAEQHWSLQNFIAMRDWHVRSHSTLVHYCVRLSADMPPLLSSDCTRLLTAMNWPEELVRPAQLARLSESELRAALLLAGILH